MRKALVGTFMVMLGCAAPVNADTDVLGGIDERKEHYGRLAHRIWELAELGYLEEESSRLLKEELDSEGFELRSGIAGLPTAFVATYGRGRPTVGVLAEFDALPGISQAAVPVRRLLEDKPNGHACGHHLFAGGSLAAAVAIKRWLAATGAEGTIKLFGTPAEEGGSGKVYMVRENAFDDVDVVLHWHPSDKNSAGAFTNLANKSAKFRFSGVSSHAAAAPERGRSALDGVEAMNYMANLLREHVDSAARIHYVITRGGEAPNVVPDFAEVFYYVRHPSAAHLQGIWERLLVISEAAAMGTGTDVSHEVIHGNHSVLPNERLALQMDRNLRRVGGVQYDAGERSFAAQITESFKAEVTVGPSHTIVPFALTHVSSSTDVGDVSWTVPTTGLYTATWVPGTSSHSWQAVAAGGTSIGVKGMIVAAKTLALTGIDLLSDPGLVEAAKEEFQRRRGADFDYRPLLGDRDPPLDYRKK